MICQCCTGAGISARTDTCEKCGYSPGGVTLDTQLLLNLDEIARRKLAAQFRITGVLGRGRRSIVYVAHEAGSGQRVALRIVSPWPREAGLDDRFRREMERVSSLDHPHIVPIAGFGRSDELAWYSMPMLDACSLATFLRSNGALELKTCLRIIEQVASALHYGHRQGIVHGHLHPGNVLLDDRDWAFVTDYAIGRLPAATPRVGSGLLLEHPPEYAAPESAICRDLAPAIDQYALAAIIYECLAGQPPFTGDSLETIRARQRQPPSLSEIRDDLPPYVGDALQRGLSPRPIERYPTVLEFVSALNDCAAPPVFAAQPLVRETSGNGSTPRLVFVDPPARGRPWQRPLLAAAALVLIGGLLLNRRRGGDEDLVAARLVLTQRPPAPQATVSSSAVTPGMPADPPAAPALTPAVSAAPAAVNGSGESAAAESVSLRARSPSVVPARTDAVPQLAPGRLLISSRPWGRIYIDDEFVGNTPKTNLDISAGRRTIRVVQDGFHPFEREILVGPGQAIRILDIVLQGVVR